MEKTLAYLFDRQRFEQNAKLEGIIHDIESRYGNMLDDDDLDFVNAAGSSSIPTACVDVLLSRHEIPEDEEKKAW